MRRLALFVAVAPCLALADYTYNGVWKNNYRTYGPMTLKIRPNGDFSGSFRDDFSKKTYTVSGHIGNRQVNGTAKFGAQGWAYKGSGTYGVHVLDWTVTIGGNPFRFVGAK